MMLSGRLFEECGGWSIDCDIVGVYTQGPTREIALANLAEAIEMVVEQDGFKVTVTETGQVDAEVEIVFVDPSNPSALLAGVLRQQRGRNGLSLSDVASKLGASSVDEYAAYEEGKADPSISRFSEFLAVVAPDFVLTIGPRVAASTPTRKASSAQRSASVRGQATPRSAGSAPTRKSSRAQRSASARGQSAPRMASSVPKRKSREKR